MVADDAEKKGHNADDQQGHGELVKFRKTCAGKGDTNSQGIDARGNGQEQLGMQTTGIKMLLLLWAETLLDHLAADEREHQEGNPVVVGLHIGLEMTDSQPTQQRHHRLKEAKEKSHPDDARR